MRGTRAKALRREAREIAVAKNIPLARSYALPKQPNTMMLPDGVDDHGKAKFKPFHYTGTIRLRPCARSIYQQLKALA